MESRDLILQYQDYTIGAWIDRVSREECPAYYPLTVLFYLVKGSLHIREGQHTSSFHAPSLVLYRKNRLGYYRKTWTEAEGAAQTYLIAFNPKFIDQEVTSGRLPQSPTDPFRDSGHVVIPPSPSLLDVFHFMEQKIVAGETPISEQDAKLITSNAMRALVNSEPNLAGFFRTERRTPVRSLREIIDHLYYSGISVEALARQSGRSLSSFYREFKNEFGAPPHKWIMERRLLEAYEILKNQPTSVTRVALDLGFKDLPHFSRRFKKRFGVAPSVLRLKKLQK